MSCIPFGSCIMDDDGVVRESSIISDNVDTQSFRSAAADGTGACSSAWEKVVVVVVDGAGGFTDVVRCEADRAILVFFGAKSWLTTIVPLKLWMSGRGSQKFPVSWSTCMYSIQFFKVREGMK
jgi:hypothetical protein